MSRAREYESTHPWLDFVLDLKRLNYRTWLLLGEVVSKCQHIAGVPLKPEVAQTLMTLFVSKGAHGTTAIEGNSLSEEEVQARVEGQLPLPESQEYMGQEIDNIVAAYNSITNAAFTKPARLTVAQIKQFNAAVLEGQPLKEGVVPGEVRTGSVVVGPYRGAPAGDCEYLLQALVDWLYELTDAKEQPDLAMPIKVLRAIMAHLYIAWIHPFGDGNGRVARLVEFFLLVEAGLPIPACHVLSSHYNRTRTAYYAVLASTSTEHNYPWEKFVEYALKGFQEQLVEELDIVRRYQREVTWENYVHEVYRDEDTPAKRRQRKIALDLPDQWTPVSSLRHISPRVAEDFAGKTAKTISRDLNALMSRNLIERGRQGVRPNRRVVDAFLAMRVTDEDGRSDLL
jgi:Fic family protein